MLTSLKRIAIEILPLFSRGRYPARMPMRQGYIKQFEYQYLRNGKYRGVIVWSLIGRFSNDDVERFCEFERETKEQALNDARRALWR